MIALSLSRPRRDAEYLFAHAARLLLLFLPAALLLLASWRESGPTRWFLGLGVVFQVGLFALHLIGRPVDRPSYLASIVMLYLLALAWMWVCIDSGSDWFLHSAQGLLMLIPVLTFGLGALANSGALVGRKARAATEALKLRRAWPFDLAGYRELPEVEQLREAIPLDPAPALALLSEPRREVRLAALVALERYSEFTHFQIEYLFHLARKSQDAETRAAIVLALGDVQRRAAIESLAEYLRDGYAQVRQAAKEAIFHDCERRWKWVRHIVRSYLAAPAFEADGPFLSQKFVPWLTREAIADFHSWSAEKGIAAQRAAQSLGAYYGALLAKKADATMLNQLRKQLNSVWTPSPWRMEIAELLKRHGSLERVILLRLLDSVNPAGLRLLAIDAILAEEKHPRAVAALIEIGRLPNRDIALATAEIAQKRLGVDLGLPVGEPLPAVTSPLAAEVTRHVISWAVHGATLLERKML